MNILKRLIARFKRQPLERERKVPKGSDTSTALIALLAARVLIHDQIEVSAANGMVPDAVVSGLLSNHEQHLAERRRQSAEAHQQYLTAVVRLDCMFEEAGPPPPDEPAPRPARQYRRISSQVGRRRQPGDLH